MKEFVSQTGGRYTYVDDLMNLQDLALSLSSIFDECDNFIISGCKVDGNTLSAGYVYLNGKVRYCTGLTGIGKWPVYIYEANSVDKVPYADSGSKVGRHIYGCVAATSVPGSVDVLTGKVPQSIAVNSTGAALRLKDAFFARHALLTDGSYASQRVKNEVVFEGPVVAESGLQSGQTVAVKNGGVTLSAGIQDGQAVIQAAFPGTGTTDRIVMESGGDICFYRGGVLAGVIGADGGTFKAGLSTDLLKAGSMGMTGTHLCNYTAASDGGTLNINVTGYNGGTQYFRNTLVGDGKGGILMGIYGASKTVAVTGTMEVDGSGAGMLALVHPTLGKADRTLTACVAWKDKNREVMANVGYLSSADTDFYIRNRVGRIVLDGDVVITGKMYLDGQEVTNGVGTNSKDTGWITMQVQNCGITTQLYVRQVGNVVSIQGRLHTHHSGTIFTLPNTVDPPRHDISYAHGVGYWRCIMKGGSRTCTVDYCSGGCSEYIGFLLTYII
jgi:hypothetical protein